MTVEEEFPYDESAFAEQPLDTSWMSGEAADDVALLETTPLDEQGAEMQMGGGMAAQMEVKPADEVSPVDAPPTENAELAAMKGDFTVQVVAYREKEKADKILANLEIAGYPAFIEKIPMKGGDWYTVRIGKYATRTAAREAVMTFAEQIRTNYFIDRVRSH
jgi:cell division septation protein DedD